jgi:hypothetical protein
MPPPRGLGRHGDEHARKAPSPASPLVNPKPMPGRPARIPSAVSASRSAVRMPFPSRSVKGRINTTGQLPVKKNRVLVIAKSV